MSTSTIERRALAGVPRKYLIAGGIAAVALIVGAVVFMRPKAPPPVAGGASPPVLTVTAASPHTVNWADTIEISGAIVPWQEAIIGPQISGPQITEVLAEVGDQVKKGEVLARLDKALLRADEAVLLASFEQADANYKRAVVLKEKGFISEQNILSLETQMKTSRAQLEAKRVQLRYADIVAPDDGVISARNATLGAIASPSQELFRLIRQNRLEWRGELSARHLTAVKPDQDVRLTLPSGGEAAAKVRQNAPALSADARLGTVYADLAPGSEAHAGMYATGRIIIDRRPAMVVPSEGVILRDGRTYVLQLADGGETSKVTLRAVETGRREGSEVEIVSGLEPTARIAVRGAGFLNDGDQVRLSEGPKPAAASK
ncbi:MAG: efflux RND transporter periplasmic adaptor subunit [Rhodospirillaceae bacterium]|nr:efflux RND transporter periplasmic adaptor subunit [Rhodospirillaceae bacterium]